MDNAQLENLLRRGFEGFAAEAEAHADAMLEQAKSHLAAAPLTGFDLDDSELEFLAAAGEAFLRSSDNPGE